MTNILVVDDSEPVRAAICALLASAGHSGLQAANGEEALDLLNRQPVGLAVVDIFMPGLDGLGFLREIRKQSSALPIIMISGGGPDMSLEHATTLADTYGANHVLFKPFEDTELLNLVGELLPA